MIGAGRLGDQVRIEAPDMVDDGAGGEATRWRLVATVPASILPTGGGKDLEGTVISIGQQRYKIWMRYRRDVTIDCRLVWERSDGPAVPMRLDSIADEDGRRRYLLAFVTAGVPQ
jgi:head-tail adaptor